MVLHGSISLGESILPFFSFPLSQFARSFNDPQEKWEAYLPMVLNSHEIRIYVRERERCFSSLLPCSFFQRGKAKAANGDSLILYRGNFSF